MGTVRSGLARRILLPTPTPAVVRCTICGHSHDYERSYLLKGHYGNEASFNKAAHTTDSSSAKYDGSAQSCPYNTPSGKVAHGTVYVVAGSAGADGSVQTGYPHNALPFAIDDGGMLYFEIQGNRLQAKFIRRTGAISDKFTINKDVNRRDTFNVAPNTPTQLTASYIGGYNWGNGYTTKIQTATAYADSVVIVRDSIAATCMADTFVIRTGIAQPHEGFQFTGNNYVTFGTAAGLGASSFTLETWFKRTGAGTGASTGTGGLAGAIPLVTKGRGEADGSNLDANYFFGISSTGTLCADFEEGSTGSTPGLNHPVNGTTPIAYNTWYHAAATYDGTTWKLYLNGVQDGTLTVGQPAQSLSIQHAALASALTSTGIPSGYFVGVMDEARIWSAARTQQQIRDSINVQIGGTVTGLIGRWGLNDSTGTAITGSGTSGINGTRINNPFSVRGAPFNINFPPNVPASYTPADSSLGVSSNAILSVTVSDPEAGNMRVTFFGREVTTADTPAFTIIPIPDTQFYTGQLNGGDNTIFKSQTGWIRDSIAAKNIVYAIQLGDCVQNGDNGGNDIEWKRADTAIKIIEDPLTTGLADGLPYGICTGNHDQTPEGSSGGTTIFSNQYFGYSRFAGRAYYGNHFGTNNDNHFQLFSAGGMNFIAISLEYDLTGDTTTIRWADSLLKAFPARRGILSSHYLINADGSWGAQGLAIYNRLKGNANLGLMLCGHVNPNGEARRSDTYNGNTIHTLLSDYQDRTAGGNGWMRIMKFTPGLDQIAVQTYSPKLNQFETDANSQFTLSYNMNGAYDTIGTALNVPSGTAASVTWPGLQSNRRYQWYVVISDGVNSTTSPVQTFTTGGSTTPLPIAYIHLSGTWKDKNAVLSWEVADEGKTTESFTVQRSPDAAHFTNISVVKSIGQHASKHTYEALDTAPLTEPRFYRIRGNEVLGAATYSNIIRLAPAGALANIEVYPNPSDGNNIFIRSGTAMEADVRIVDAGGLTRYHAAVQLSGAVRIPVKLAPGTYFVRVTAGDLTDVKRLVVQ